MKKFKGVSYQYHEKHQAWVIPKPIHIVHTCGGSWFYPEHFNSEKELKTFLDSPEGVKRGAK